MESFSEGDRVRDRYGDREGTVIGVHPQQGLTIQQHAGPVLPDEIAYSVVWDGSGQPANADGDDLLRVDSRICPACDGRRQKPRSGQVIWLDAPPCHTCRDHGRVRPDGSPFPG